MKWSSLPLVLLLAAWCPAQSKQIQVPGAWEQSADGGLKDYNGYAWYRCYITVPAAWKDRKLELLVDRIGDVHEAYLNGVAVGNSGSFPPRFQSGSKQPKRYEIANRSVKFGAQNTLAIRVYNKDGDGGFLGKAPTLFAGNQAILLEGKWLFHVGDDQTIAQPLGGRDSVEAVFDKTIAASEAERVAGGALSPAESLKQLSTSDGLVIDQVLAEPLCRQPLFIDFDERGRMWLMQYIQYPRPAGLQMVSKDRHWRAVYDKVPPAPPNHFRGADKITIHEDSDGDGIYDKHKTFVDGLSIATSFARGRGGVWVLNPPYLLFYPDQNNDDVPDADPVVHLQGFGMEDTHSVANSLRWGPDGWLYAAQGSTVSGNISKPGVDEPPAHTMGQLIWRYHPETTRYEIFAEGGGNAFGVEIDSAGRIFSGHNGGNTRGFHYVQGGYFRKGFTKHGPLSNPFAYGYFEAMKHHNVPRFTHNFIIYDGGPLPEQYHDTLFGIEPLSSRVVYSEISPDSSSYKTKDLGFAVESKDHRFRPVDVKLGPDGSIYVADFYEPLISHRQHFVGQVDRRTGRVYRIRGVDHRPLQPINLATRSSVELVELLDHPNKWFRQTALRLLADRRDSQIVDLLRDRLLQASGQGALESLWALNLTAGLPEKLALQTLSHSEPQVRLWTIRLLCDDGQVGGKIAERLVDLATEEQHPQVRSQLVSSARRLPAKISLQIVRSVLFRTADASDIHIPLLLWWAVETSCKEDPEYVIALLEEKEIWNLQLVKDHLLARLMQRFAQSGGRKDLAVCADLLRLAPNKECVDQLMSGFETAFKGRTLASLPEELVLALGKIGGGSTALKIRQGDSRAVREAIEQIESTDVDKAKKIQWIELLGEVQARPLVPVACDLIDQSKDDGLVASSLAALGTFKDDSIARFIVQRLEGLGEESKAVAESILASRAGWSLITLTAIENGALKPEQLAGETVRKMTVHPDKRIAQLVKKHWGDLEGATNEKMQEDIARISKLLDDGPGKPVAGRALFQKSCGKCHLLYGQGGNIGPDLTSYRRDDVVRILLNVINPDAEIREGFETVLVVTLDGRTVTGFLFDQDAKVIVVRGADGRKVTIARDDIEEMIPQKQSIMPQGLLKDMSDQQIRDLFAYLRTSQPLNY